MKIKKGCTIAIALIILLTFSSCAAFGLNHLPEGEFLYSSSSPDGGHQIDVYLCSGNATTDYSIRCAVVDASTDDSRNFYWEYKKQSVDIEWIDDVTVEIDGKRLNILTDSYDWRTQ